MGVSTLKDIYIPPITEPQPIKTAKNAMRSGVAENIRAVAAGISSIAAINNTPTTLIATATTTARSEDEEDDNSNIVDPAKF